MWHSLNTIGYIVVVTSLFEELGGELALRLIINDFVDRLFDDAMIGYLFRGASRERIKEMEFQFAAAHLGAPVAYTGQPLVTAHRKHRILEGHFTRRLQVLKHVLAEHRCPPAVVQHWIEHTESLRASVLSPDGGACIPNGD